MATAGGGRKEESAGEKGSREERGGNQRVCGWGRGLGTYTGFMLCLPHGRS